MKKLFVAVTVLFVSLNFMACAPKKDNKTRLQRGAGRSNQVAGTVASNGWDILNNSAQEVQLYSQDPDSVARAFLGANNDETLGYVKVNSVVMKIKFDNNSRIDSYNSRIGFRFYDNQYTPVMYYVGPENGGSAQGFINGSHVQVTFHDGGTILVDGTISGGTFSGSITYDNGQFLGSFSVPVQYSLQ